MAPATKRKRDERDESPGTAAIRKRQRREEEDDGGYMPSPKTSVEKKQVLRGAQNVERFASTGYGQRTAKINSSGSQTQG